jgi:Bardet-Biedl syndrome 9 protein
MLQIGGGVSAENAGVNVMSFRYHAGPDVTIIVSKNAGRYRIQSSHFEALWLITYELAERLSKHFASSSTEKDPYINSFQEDLPLQDYFKLIDEHFKVFILDLQVLIFSSVV